MVDVNYCYNCGEKGKLRKVTSHDNSTRENVGTEGNPFIINFYDVFDIYQCYNCNNVTIYRTEWYEGEERDIVQYSDKEPIELFGKIIYPNLQHENKHHIPNIIYNSFLSSIKVKNIDRAFSLIGLRRTLEMICKEQGYNEGFLGKKLSNMAQDGIIPPVIDNLAEFLKDEGNKAAHGDDVEFSLKLVNDMIEFTTIIMNYIYVLPKKILKVQKDIEEKVL